MRLLIASRCGMPAWFLLQADCETVRKWMVKNSAESENLTWILANTKQCPKCQ
jgi:hypothetical protein